MGGCVADRKPRQIAHQRLSTLGLNDEEIRVLCFLVEGYSSRRIATFTKRSQTFVLKVQRAAQEAPALRVRTVDPAKLEAMANRGL